MDCKDTYFFDYNDFNKIFFEETQKKLSKQVTKKYFLQYIYKKEFLLFLLD
jgi:hypothetical protein